VKQQLPEPELPPKPLPPLELLHPLELELPPKPLPLPEPEPQPKPLPEQLLGARPKLPPDPELPPEPGKHSGKPDAWPKSPLTEPDSPRIRLLQELELKLLKELPQEPGLKLRPDAALRPEPGLRPGLPQELPPGPKPKPLRELEQLQDPGLPQKQEPVFRLPRKQPPETGPELFLWPKPKIVLRNKLEPEQQH